MERVSCGRLGALVGLLEAVSYTLHLIRATRVHIMASYTCLGVTTIHIWRVRAFEIPISILGDCKKCVKNVEN